MTGVVIGMNWKNLLESVSESVNDELRLCNKYLVAQLGDLQKLCDREAAWGWTKKG
jgi:hypothetical protein